MSESPRQAEPERRRSIRGWLPALFGRGSERPQDGERDKMGGQGTPPGAGEERPPEADWAGLQKQVQRMGREQLRLNALIEAQQREFEAALQQLREQDERCKRQLAEAQAGRTAEQAEARLQAVQRLLPVLDGLDQALAAAERLSERLPSAPRAPVRPASRLPLWLALVAWPLMLFGFLFPERVPRGRREDACAGLADDLEAWRGSYRAWLRGLELAHERFLETLALEGVRPIDAVGHPFDPRRHVAVEAVPAGPGASPGTVVTELRRGYVAGERVLRYAEVAVARADERSTE